MLKLKQVHLASVLEGAASWSSPVYKAIATCMAKKNFEVMKDAAVILNVYDLPLVIFYQLQKEHAEK